MLATVRTRLVCLRSSSGNFIPLYSYNATISNRFLHSNILQSNVLITCIRGLHTNITQDNCDNDVSMKKKTKNGEERHEIDPNVNEFELLLQQSKQFQFDVDKNSWQMESKRRNQKMQYFTKPSKRSLFHHGENAVSHWELGKMAVDQLVEKDTDEINYDAEFEKVWDDEQVKQRKWYRALRREHDKDQVCTNCGERGHRARNCLVPRICSNCGNLGHAARQCRFRQNPDTIDEFLVQEKDIQKKKKKKRKLRETAAKAVKNPGMPVPKEVPTSDLNKRNESLRKELDAELDAYADTLEEQARKRRELKEMKEAERANAKRSEK